MRGVFNKFPDCFEQAFKIDLDSLFNQMSYLLDNVSKILMSFHKRGSLELVKEESRRQDANF